MVLEVSVAGRCEAIVTFNKRDFGDLASFGLALMTPRELLVQIGESP